MTIVVNGSGLTIEKLVNVARFNEKVELHPDSLMRIKECRAMFYRINVHAHGNSGCRPEITQTLVRMLNEGVTPYVCQKGSVGACGDLAPMAQIALLMLGQGKAFYKGELFEGNEAMKKTGIPFPGLKARDGLSIINGSNLLTAMSAIFLFDANNWLKQAEIARS